MRIERKYQIEKAVGRDDDRPILNYVQVEPEGMGAVAVALDRFLLAVVPCTLDEDDEPGLVWPAVVTSARRETSREAEMTLQLLADRVVYPVQHGQAFKLRMTGGLMKFPDWRGLLPTYLGAGTRVTLSLKALQRVAAALGTDNLILTIRAPDQAVVIEPQDDEHARRRVSEELVAPYGLVMPMYTNFGAQNLDEVAAEWAHSAEAVDRREPVAEVDVAWPEEVG